jgi:cytochrome c biogenesis protein CcdA
MTFGAAPYGLGLVAGALSTLSSCVLPLVRVLIASAVNAHARPDARLAHGPYYQDLNSRRTTQTRILPPRGAGMRRRL